MPRNARRSARTSVQKRRFGPLQREVNIGQGTWYIEEGDPASAIAALRRGIDLGMDRIPYLTPLLNTEVIPLERAVEAYQIFHDGSPKKFVIDPHNMTKLMSTG
jgi:hypothetical protein